MYLRIMNIIGS